MAGHPVTEAVLVSATSLPAGDDSAATQAATPAQPVPFQLPAAPAPVPPGAVRGRPRLGPVLLVAASIVIAAGIVAAAIIIRSPGSTPSSQGGTSSSPPAVTPSASPARQISYGQAGYRLGGVLNPGAEGSISSVSWNPKGTLVATGDKNGSTYIWDVTTGKQAAPSFVGPGKAYAAAFSPDGTELAIGYSNGMTYLWDYKAGQILARLRDPGSAQGREVDSLAFSPDGATLATGDGNGYINLWNVATLGHAVKLIASLADPAGAGVFSVTFSPDGGMLATGDYDGHVYTWDVASGTTTATFELAGGNCPTQLCAAVSALAFSRDGRLLAAGSEGGSAVLWSVAAGAGSPIGPPAAAAGQSIWAFSFSGPTLLAMADADGHAYLYRVAGAGPTASIAGALTDPNSGGAFGNGGVGALAFSADGRYLVTGDTNGNAYLWRTG